YLAPSQVQQRLRSFVDNQGGHTEKPADAWVTRIAKLSGPLAKLSVPEEGWEKSSLRTRFMNAGFRGEQVPMIYFGAKTLLAIAAPVVLWPILILSNPTQSSTTTMFYLLLASA